MDGLQAEHKSCTKAIMDDISEGPIKCDHVRWSWDYAMCAFCIFFFFFFEGETYLDFNKTLQKLMYNKEGQNTQKFF